MNFLTSTAAPSVTVSSISGVVDVDIIVLQGTLQSYWLSSVKSKDSCGFAGRGNTSRPGACRAGRAERPRYPGEAQTGRDEQDHSDHRLSEDELADTEQGGVHRGDARDPVAPCDRAAFDPLLAVAKTSRDSTPPTAARADPVIKRVEVFVRLRLRHVRHGQPHDSAHPHGDQHYH